jgi:hypothetical protein
MPETITGRVVSVVLMLEELRIILTFADGRAICVKGDSAIHLWAALPFALVGGPQVTLVVQKDADGSVYLNDFTVEAPVKLNDHLPE